MGVATTTIIGQHIGAKDYDGAQRSVYLILRVALVYSALMIALFVGFAGPLTLIFSSGFEDADGQIAKMATTMLRLLALYTIANSCKLVLSGALRAAGDLPKEIEQVISSATLDSIKRTCEEAAIVAEDDVRQLWDELSKDMQSEFKLKLSVGKTGEPDWSASRKRLVEQVEKATSSELQNPYLCDGLKKLFRRRRRKMFGFLFLSVVGLLGGGWLAWKGLAPYQILAFGAAASALLAAAFAGLKGTSRIRAFYSKELDAQRTSLHDVMRKAFNEGVDKCYRDFVLLFDPLRKVCTEQREKFKPLLEAADELEGDFC